ncbi:hypothetical protein, partial [Paraburkholderia sp. BR10879]|uniref:hypothetical protein n=1 Tax=Paraburkholderia sp. BR10879 TaxID=3236990 RepID=UPI00397A31B4
MYRAGAGAPPRGRQAAQGAPARGRATTQCVRTCKWVSWMRKRVTARALAASAQASAASAASVSRV